MSNDLLQFIAFTFRLYLIRYISTLLVYFRFSFVYRNKEKEESRQGKLTEFKETGKWPGMKSKPVENVAWSKKLEKKDRKEKRKRIKDLKRMSKADEDHDDNDDLDEDYRLLKKMRKVFHFLYYNVYTLIP